jgi:DNA-damage-inducible protein J
MANLNICVDDILKKQAETLFSELGISLSTATTIFLKQAVRCNGIPFELRIDPFYSFENQERLIAAKQRMELTGGTVHGLIEADGD